MKTRSFSSSQIHSPEPSQENQLFPMKPPEQIEQHFLVEGECDGFRLDQFLQKRIRRLSRNRIQRVIKGECFVDGVKAKPSQKVRMGQKVVFFRPAPNEPEVPKNIEILYTDPWFYAIDKPSGLPVHPTARYYHSTLTAVLKERFPQEPLQIAHRLDRETSGLMLVARHKQAASTFKKAFAQRKMKKKYLAIVHGVFEQQQVLVTEPIGLAGGYVRVKMGIRSIEEGGLPAQTEIRVLQRFPNHSLVECFPLTGRQHQIRVHLDFLGHPIVGDKLYPDDSIFVTWSDFGDDAVKDLLPLPRHALHAAYLAFQHPETNEFVELYSPLPSDLEQFLKALS